VRLTTSHERFGSSAPLSSSFAFALVTGALLLVFAVDRATTSAPVQHLYYLPIILAGVRFRMRGGILAGLSATLLYHAANPHLLTFRYEESDLVQIALFLAVGVITARLADDAGRLRQLALTDDLTGLHNLRSFEARLLALMRTARASRTSIAVLVLDVDHLKLLNDRYGHLAGAEAVRTVGQIIGGGIPADAVGCRYGGDEFVIAVPRSDAFQGYRLADDLRHGVHACAPVLAGHAFPAGTLTISVGVVSASPEPGAEGTDAWRRDVESAEAVFRAADAALYRAKAKGRNQVCVA
jgi:diguanylate cyclase (GGDEF)-like protein